MKTKSNPAREPSLSPSLKGYLYLTAGVTGAAIMVVEILGAKMLSPVVGMSHFVWTAQIAVTLVALACGYYLGGRLADRSPQLSLLYWAILSASAYLALTVLLCKPVAYWALDFNLAAGSLLASTFLFFVPLALLAMTGPFLVRVLTSSLAGVGGNVGRLTSISTLGSFAGTMCIGYLMIPLLPNSVTMYVTAITLAAIALGYFALYRPRGLKAAIPLLLWLGVAGAVLRENQAPQYRFVEERFRGNSHFGELQVVQRREGGGRLYLNDNLVQNTYDPARKQSESSFTYLLAELARAYTTNIHDVLCIGLGVGIVPMDFADHGAKVDVVEINPMVVPLAERFFELQRHRFRLTIDDARHYLNRCTNRYDVVVLDAFLGDSSPSHLLTREAFAAIKEVLRPGGTLVMNSFAALEPGHDFFAGSICQTLRAVFPGLRMHSSGNGAIFFVATLRPNPAILRTPNLAHVHPAALRDTQSAMSSVIDTVPESGRILTDDYNPVEFYDALNREATRRRLAGLAKSL